MSVVDIKVFDDRFSFITNNDSVYSIRKQIFVTSKSQNDFNTKKDYELYVKMIQNFNKALQSFQNNSNKFKFNISLSKEGRPCLIYHMIQMLLLIIMKLLIFHF